MGTVTYPQEQVADFIMSRFIPLKFDVTRDKKMFEAFEAQWTPTILICDEKKREHHRTTGYLSPEEFVSEMELGLAKLDFHRGRYQEAAQQYRQILSAHPGKSAASEAVYFSGVCNYMATHDPSHLKQAYTELKERYPQSDWTRKAEVWS